MCQWLVSIATLPGGSCKFILLTVLLHDGITDLHLWILISRNQSKLMLWWDFKVILMRPRLSWYVAEDHALWYGYSSLGFYFLFIHSILICCSVITCSSLVNTCSVLKMPTAYIAQTAWGAFGAWSRINWSIFYWVKLMVFRMISGILKPLYVECFTNMSKWFCFFCRVWILVNTCVSFVAQEMIQIWCICADVDARPMHSPLVCALDKHQHQRLCTGLIISPVLSPII